VSRSWEGGSTTAWRKVRAAVLMRDGGQCRLRTQVCIGTATHAHHTLGRAQTGDDPAFIIAACAPCNLHVGDPMKAADPPCVSVTRW
jgi:5-methylcytosine-specific restriction endonuclease McrA